LAYSVVAPAFGAIATAIALVHGFANKLRTLRGGASPSPFGANGELQGFSDAQH
jgi:hypothetical protein